MKHNPATYCITFNQIIYDHVFNNECMVSCENMNPQDRDFCSLQNWSFDTYELNKDTKISEIVDKVINSTICLMDTTQYSSKINPYIYFALGLAHGFERKVIPITNKQVKTNHPFDTRGLWHIFFEKEEEFKKQFQNILPKVLMTLNIG